MLFITLPIMNQLEPKLQLKTPSFKLMLPPSDNGIYNTTVKIQEPKKVLPPKKLLLNLNTFKLNQLSEIKKMLSMLNLNLNSLKTESQLVFLPDLDNPEEWTVIYQKEKNLNSTSKNQTKKENDSTFFLQKIIYLIIY